MTNGSDELSGGGSLIRPFLGGSPPPDVSKGSISPGTSAPGTSAPGTSSTSVRPFLVTSGRTTQASSIPVETQVLITPEGETVLESLTFEYQDIVALCIEPLAVAEIAARLSLHLGVIRVLVTDLQQQGLVTTYSPEVDPTDDVDIIMRVINGLRQRT
jgi:hypothetical protein